MIITSDCTVENLLISQHTEAPSASQQLNTQEVCPFSENNTNNGEPESRSVPPKAMQWQFSPIVFLTGCTPRRGGRKKLPFGRELTTCRGLFRWRGGFGMCHCKQAKVLRNLVSEWCPELSCSNMKPLLLMWGHIFHLYDPLKRHNTWT